MKHIVFLGGRHHPDFSAVGFCAFQVQKALVADMKVSSISFKTQPHQKWRDERCGIHIHRIETRHMRRISAVKNKVSELSKLIHAAVRTTGAVRRLLSAQTIDPDLVKAFTQQLDKMESKPAAVVPLVFPFESVVAALEYKKVNPSVKVIPYVFDDFVNSESLHILPVAQKLKRQRHLQLQRDMLERSTAVLSMHPLKDHFYDNFVPALVAKIIFLEHPLLVKPHTNAIENRSHIIRICFAGALIKKIHQPDLLIDLLGEIQVGSNVQVDFYVMGNAADKVPTKTFVNAVQISNHGRVEKAVADAAVLRADILINIGEVQGRQVSSKIFEYMATGKPVIHLACKENDVSTKILRKYPLALCLLMTKERRKDNAQALLQFILKSRSSQMSFEDVLNIFPEAAPETTANQIRKIVLDEPLIKEVSSEHRGQMVRGNVK